MITHLNLLMMIDRVNLRVNLADPNYIIDNFQDCGKTSIHKKTGYIILEWKIENLLCRLHGSQLRIQGSLHKYFKGNNYGDFTRTEIRSALNKLCYVLNISAREIKCTKLEFGVNVQMNNPLDQYLHIMREYKGKRFIELSPLPNTSKIAGRTCNLSYMRIKFYDKSWDAIKRDKIKKEEIPENLLRVEITVKSSKLKSLPYLGSANDLPNRKCFAGMVNEMKKIYSEIDKLPIISNMKDFSPSELRDIYFLNSEYYQIYQDELKSRDKEIWKNERRRVRSIKNRIAKYGNILSEEIETKMYDKFDALAWG